MSLTAGTKLKIDQPIKSSITSFSSQAALWPLIVFDLSLSFTADQSYRADQQTNAVHAGEGESTAYENLNLLHALVLAAKPTRVLETGTGRGLGTLALASALRMNGRGCLVSTDARETREARSLCRRYGLDDIITLVGSEATEYLRNYQGDPFDFVFLNGDVDKQYEEYESLRSNGLLVAEGTVAFCDTSDFQIPKKNTTNDGAKGRRSFSDTYTFPLSRGLSLARLRRGDREPSALTPSPSKAERQQSERSPTSWQARRLLAAPVFRHSGERGDIIYGLPLVRSFGGGSLLIDPNSTAGGKRPLGEEAARAMLPLLEAQPYISTTGIYDGESIDIDLDAFRGVGDSLYQEHLAHSHCRGLGISPAQVDLNSAWLSVPSIALAEIVLARTGRREGTLDWSVLKRFERRCLFIGSRYEHSLFQRQFGLTVQFFHARDYLELAGVVAGAKLIVSDQTFVFALAEGLKIPRVLEVFPAAPNCLPQSDNGHTMLTEQLLDQYCGGGEV